MTQPEFPPEGWFPDPHAQNQLRYWSGTAWTHHTAPVPAAQPVASTQLNSPSPQQFTQAATAVSTTGPTAWTKQTVIVLIACIALVIGAGVTGGALLLTQRANHQDEAQRTLEQFVAAATVGDDAWRDFASESLQQKVPIGAPIFGESKTAAALDLSIDYTLRELEFFSTQSGSLSDRDDHASAIISLTYSFVFDGEQHTAEAMQKIWLTRPFYFGSELPQTAQERAEPTSVGPWKVTSFTHAEQLSDHITEVYYKTDLVDEYDEFRDGDACFSPLRVMQDISRFARVSGTTQSSCQVGDGSGTLVGDDVDHALIAGEFPVLESELTFELYSLPELTRMPVFDVGQHPLPPFQQFLVTTSAGQYVFTVALVDVGEGDTGHTGSARFISVQVAEETEASE